MHSFRKPVTARVSLAALSFASVVILSSQTAPKPVAPDNGKSPRYLNPLPIETSSRDGSPQGVSLEWNAAVQLLIATNGGVAYRKRALELFPTVAQRFGSGAWSAVRVLPYMDAAFKSQLEAAVKTYVEQLDRELAATPFGVPPSRGGWGGSSAIIDMGVRMYFLHRAFPALVGKDYTLRAANYILGTHPVSSASYVSAVGTSSKLKAYGSNRADHSFIPGGVIPGHIFIKPDFPECIDDFGFL